MDEILKQDVFFFITSVAVIFLTFLVGALVIYLILIAHKINRIVGRVKQETDIIADVVGEVRKRVKKFFTNVRKGKSNG